MKKYTKRVMVGILIYHAYYFKKSFRELKEDFRYNIVLQYFCGYEELQIMKIDHLTTRNTLQRMKITKMNLKNSKFSQKKILDQFIDEKRITKQNFEWK